MDKVQRMNFQRNPLLHQDIFQLKNWHQSQPLVLLKHLELGLKWSFSVLLLIFSLFVGKI